jgi:hypothetical protein
MELKEFVKKILVDLDGAVSEARGEMQRDLHFSDGKDQRTVEFDIAVSVEETNAKSGKAGVKVLPFVEGGGSIGKENKNSTVSRVKFGVRIGSMTKEEERALEVSNARFEQSREDFN